MQGGGHEAGGVRLFAFHIFHFCASKCLLILSNRCKRTTEPPAGLPRGGKEMDILVKRAQRGDAEAFIELFDPAYGMSAPYLIEGKFLDSHTFAGIIRVDLMDMQVMDDKGEWKQIENFPEEFLYELHVTGIYAKPGKGEHMEGNWDFVLDVKLNHENTVIKEVNETNENGVGIGTVTKTAYELHAELLLPEGASEADYIVAVCDADGKPLESQGSIAEIYSVYQRDVSKVYIYVVDYYTYMDECKGNNAYRLPEKALFQTEVQF